MYTESPIDWDAFQTAGKRGQILELLLEVPPERWAERSRYGLSFLHCACRGPNEAAVALLLRRRPSDANVCDAWNWTPAHFAASWLQPRLLEMLCVAGANMLACNDGGYRIIDCTFWSVEKKTGETMRVLMANGVRLNTMREESRKYITPDLEEFERGVLCCRVAVVALLRVKRAGKLVRWDKFLLRELSIAVWATRYDEKWQNSF